MKLSTDPDVSLVRTLNRKPKNCLVIKSADLRKEAASSNKDAMSIFGEVLVSLKKDCPYGAIAVDTLDDLSVFAEELAVKNLNNDANYPHTGKEIGDFKFGRGWHEHRRILMSIIHTLISLARTVILVTHNKTHNKWLQKQIKRRKV